MAALEHLVDTARENADAEVVRYNAILRQTRGLAENPVLQRVLLKLLGSKEEIAIAKEIDNATKNCPPPPYCVVYQLAVNAVFQESSPIAIIMVMEVVLLVTNAADRGILLAIAGPRKDVISVNT